MGGTALYHPMGIKTQPTPYHPSPQARVPLGGETPGGEKQTHSGQKEKPPQRSGFAEKVHFLLGRNRGEICRTNAGQGQRKGQKACSEERPKREGSRCNQAPGSTLVRKEIHGVTRAFALARIVPGKLPGSSAHLVCWRVPHRPVAPVLGIAVSKSRETPAGAGGRMVEQRCL